MAKKEVLWKCEPRTRAKLEIISAYLEAWFNILANKGFQHVIYIDGFCGPGKYRDGESGSPLIATRIANATAQVFPNFKATLIFIDEDADALEHLSSLDDIKNLHPNVTIQIRQGKFSEEVDEILSYLKKNSGSPTFSFIDPFGFGHSPLTKLKLLMHNEHSELFINFWCGFMNRFKEHPDDDIKARIKEMVGVSDLTPIVDAYDSIEAFCLLFEEKLKELGKFTLKFAMRDEGNIRDNAFFFCGRQPRGFEKIKEAMWKIDPERGNEFSAHLEKKVLTNVQTDLFSGPVSKTAQTSVLSSDLLKKFGGTKDVPVTEIFRWVIEETGSFLPKHCRVELENLLDRKLISFSDTRGSSRKRKKNTWPEGINVSFK